MCASFVPIGKSIQNFHRISEGAFVPFFIALQRKRGQIIMLSEFAEAQTFIQEKQDGWPLVITLLKLCQGEAIKQAAAPMFKQFFKTHLDRRKETIYRWPAVTHSCETFAMDLRIMPACIGVF